MKKTSAGSPKPEQLDIDVRFLLANERTLLAWVRTALALIAGGIALTQFGDRTKFQITLGVAVILIGAGMAVVGYVRFRAADSAIRSGRLPSLGYGHIFQVAGVIGFALILAAIELAHLH
jgi:putative membrane protein